MQELFIHLDSFSSMLERQVHQKVVYNQGKLPPKYIVVHMIFYVLLMSVFKKKLGLFQKICLLAVMIYASWKPQL